MFFFICQNELHVYNNKTLIYFLFAKIIWQSMCCFSKVLSWFYDSSNLVLANLDPMIKTFTWEFQSKKIYNIVCQSRWPSGISEDKIQEKKI